VNKYSLFSIFDCKLCRKINAVVDNRDLMVDLLVVAGVVVVVVVINKEK
jgi:hypothetical protein